MRLDGKRVLLTGGGTGIGRALARQLAAKGAALVLCGRRRAPLEETAESLPEGAVCHVVTADITEAEDREALVQAVKLSLGGLDILVNNAGVVPAGPLRELDDAALETLLRTNLMAPIALVRDTLPLLKESGDARVVNVGSMFGDIAFPLFAAYSATKFGMRGFSDALRRELKDDGVGVTYAAPRATKTPAAGNFDHLSECFDMKYDAPEKVAAQIVRAIEKERRSVYPKGPERFFTMVQRLCPALIDNAVTGQLRTWRKGRPAV